MADYAEKKELLFFTVYSVLRDAAMYAGYGRNVAMQNINETRTICRLSEAIGYHKAMKAIEHVGKAWRMAGQNVNYKLMADSLTIRIQEVFHG